MECTHECPWGYDDQGNHWCTECSLWHDFPHNSVTGIPDAPYQDQADCDRDTT
jgi:hypothetical protein